MICDEIRSALLEQADEAYRQFHGSLVPTQDRDNLIGVRVPVMRALAKTFAKRKDVELFFRDVPHRYYEENAMHAFLIEQISDFEDCMEETRRFLPYIDSWGVCDSFSPKVFKNHLPELLDACRLWLRADHVYTVRYGLVMLLKHFLTDEYAPEALELAARVDSEAYYVNMAVAWLFAEAVGKCPGPAMAYLEHRRLKPEVHNKAIQKAVESRRVPQDTKAYLKTLKYKGNTMSR